MRSHEVKLTEMYNRNVYLSNRKYTMIVPFSRTWAVAPWFECLLNIQWENDFWENVTIFFCADGGAALNEISKHIVKLPERSKYRVFKTDTQPIAEFGDLLARRRRICSIWSQLWRMVEGPIVLGSEDDSLFPPDAFMRLTKILETPPTNPNDKETGFVQASIIGRWSSYMVPHWTLSTSPTKSGQKLDTWRTGLYTGENIVPIDGGGWYCFAALKAAGDNASWKADPKQHVGPDVLMVNSIKKKYNTLGVWDIWVKHLLEEDTYLDIETVDYLDQITIREVTKGRWGLDQKIIHKPFSEFLNMNDDNNNKMVRIVVRRTFQGVEGLCTRGTILTVTMKRYLQLEAKRLAELLPEEVNETLPEVQDLDLDEPEEVVNSPKLGPEPPEPKDKGGKGLGLKEISDFQEVMETIKKQEEEEEEEEKKPKGRPKKDSKE